MKLTEEVLREDPSWIVLLMGLPAETFWQLVEAVEIAYRAMNSTVTNDLSANEGWGVGGNVIYPWLSGWR
ncbi:MAG: hypothetical protein BroJett011_64000 [Chloroflexota bacterium]|nr:MAG: hypothetical protein BroJett011_64000 [Chloroflexota bacterium]